MKQKLHSRAGFTLAETLTAVLILLMVASVVAAGIPAAKNAYEKVTMSANAEVLLSTTVSALRDELYTARQISVSDDKDALTYYSPQAYSRGSGNTGFFSRIYLDKSGDGGGKNGILMLQQYLQYDPENGPGDAAISGAQPRQLVTDAASTRDLYVTCSDLSYDPETGLVTVSGLRVKRISNGREIASIDTTVIRTINREP